MNGPFEVFASRDLYEIAFEHRNTLNALYHIETQLNNRLTLMREPIRALILSVASQEPLLLVGPPGVAKSLLIRTFCDLIGIPMHQDNRANAAESNRYFEYLLTPFTEPSELLGFYDFSSLQSGGQPQRIETGMLLPAEVVYLDEVFNGSSAILNTLLAFMNERLVHDRGERKPAHWKCLFGATNFIPRESALLAFLDRFTLRSYLHHVDAETAMMQQLVQTGWTTTYQSDALQLQRYPALLDALDVFRIDLQRLQMLENSQVRAFFTKLTQITAELRNRNLSEMSNRRLIKFVRIMLINCLYRVVNSDDAGNQSAYVFNNDELALWRFVTDRRSEFEEDNLPAVAFEG